MNDQLEAAFPVVPIPAPSEIVAQRDEDSDRLALRAAVGSRAWTNVTYSNFRSRYPGPVSEAFFLLTAKGQAYLLPAFLRMIAEHRAEVDDLPEAMLFYFSDARKESGALVSTLSKDQKRLVLTMLESEFQGTGGRSVALQKARQKLECERTG